MLSESKITRISQMTDTEVEEKEVDIQKLQEIIRKQEKKIKKQEKKIKKMSEKHDYYESLEYIKMINHYVLREIVKNMEILLNFINEEVEYKIYGDFFERIFTDGNINGSCLNVYLNTSKIGKMEGLCNIYYTLNLIKNKEDYNLIRQYINDDGMCINYYKLELIINNSIINLFLHDTCLMYKLDTTSQNICIKNNRIENIKDNTNKNLYSTKSGFDLLINLYLLKNQRTNLLHDRVNRKIIDNDELLNAISTQSYYEKNNIIIENKFEYNVKDCPVCLETKKCFKLECNHDFCIKCIKHHVNNNNYENKKCPLCRGEMILKQ